MLTKTTRFAITALFASPVFAQQSAIGPLDRVLHFAHAETDQQLQEIATDIRGITEMPQVSVDTAQKTLTLHGTAAQITAAEWLLTQWDNSAPAQQPENPAAHQYRLSSDDIVRVFHLSYARTPQTLQEVATDVRSIADIRRLFTYNAPSVMTVRGDASQIALAEWLVSQLDQPANQAARSTSHEYRPSGAVDDVVRIFYAIHAGTPQGLQEIATDVRSIADIRRLFTYHESSALIVRGTAAQIALAEWLVNELDQPANQPPRTPSPHEYNHLSGAIDDVVRVFFLTHAESPQRLQQIATEVRSTAEIRRVFIYNATRAIAARGTAAQIAWAERLIAERDR